MDKGTMRLANIGNGALAELFNVELQQVLSNIRDPNSDVKKESIITVKVTIKPNENRSAATLKYSVVSHKAPTRVRETSVMIGAEDGLYIAKEIGNETPGQMGMNVLEMKKGE